MRKRISNGGGRELSRGIDPSGDPECLSLDLTKQNRENPGFLPY